MTHHTPRNTHYAPRTTTGLLRVTLDHVWLFAGVAFIALRPLLTTIPPNDFWWHMATGRLIVESGQIPLTDSFSYTQSGQPFYNQSWLAQVLMFGIHGLGGVPLLVVTQAAVLALAYGLLLRLCIRRSGALRLSVGLLLLTTMPVSFSNWIIRPQTYVFPMFVAFLYILTRWRLPETGRPGDKSDQPSTLKARHTLWLLPPLMVLWVNMHGSFVLGGALIGLTLVGEAARRFGEDRREEAAWARRPVGGPQDVLARPERPERPALRQLFMWGALTAAAMLVNPRGLEVLGYVRNLLSSSQVTTLVEEWAAPTIRDLNGVIFFLYLMLCAVVLAYARRRPDPVDMLLAGVLLWLALGAWRNIVWFAMVAAPLIAVQAATWRLSDGEVERWGATTGHSPRLPVAQSQRAFQGLPMVNAALVGMIALLLVLGLPWVKPALGLPPELGELLDPNTPVAAVERLRADPQRPRHLYHAMAYGSYLIWAAPGQPVFIDPRIELYPYEQWIDYIEMNNGRNVARMMERYAIDGMLLDNKEQAGLLKLLRADPAWEVRYEDERCTYLVMRGV